MARSQHHHQWQWQGALKKAKVKLNLLTDIDMLLMLKEGIRSGMLCHSLMWES